MAAIFMWRQIEEAVLTTTLYPIEVNDAMAVSITVSASSMDLVPLDNIQATYAMVDGTYTQLRWFLTDGPYDEDIQATYAMIDGTYTQLRAFLTDGPYDEDIQATYAMIDGTLTNKLVEGYDEEFLLPSLTITTDSTMDLV